MIKELLKKLFTPRAKQNEKSLAEKEKEEWEAKIEKLNKSLSTPSNRIEILIILKQFSSQELRILRPVFEESIFVDPILIGVLLGKESTERIRKYIVYLSKESAIEDKIILVLKDSDSRARACAAEILSDVGTDHAKNALSDALHDQDENVRDFAVQALSKIAIRPSPIQKIIQEQIFISIRTPNKSQLNLRFLDNLNGFSAMDVNKGVKRRIRIIQWLIL